MGARATTTFRARWRQLFGGADNRPVVELRPRVGPSTEQEPDPPDPVLAVLVAMRLLSDLGRHLDPEYTDGRDRAELIQRIGAVYAVLRRVRDRLEAESRGR